jgi:predicted metal-dependent hydrolase
VADLLRQGIIAFNEARYFDAHERWEDLWRGASGEGRVYYQGLVQIAVGLHHMSNRNPGGGARVLKRGIHNLMSRAADHPEIDNRRLISDIQEIIESGTVIPITILAALPPASPPGSASDETV